MPKAGSRTKSCRVCRDRFIPRQSMQVVCGVTCGIAYSRQQKSRRQKAEHRKRKAALKGRSDHTREAQAAVNSYVRARDAERPCMACGGTWSPRGITGSGWDAGHYRSRGAAPHLRFHLLNIWRVCTRCNRELSGNVVEMRKGMVSVLGESRVQELEHDHQDRSYSIDDLIRIKRLFTRRARWYRARRLT